MEAPFFCVQKKYVIIKKYILSLTHIQYKRKGVGFMSEEQLIYIKDIRTDAIREYGKDENDAMKVSDSGKTLSYYNLQTGESSIYGNIRFCNGFGQTPQEVGEGTPHDEVMLVNLKEMSEDASVYLLKKSLLGYIDRLKNCGLGKDKSLDFLAKHISSEMGSICAINEEETVVKAQNEETSGRSATFTDITDKKFVKLPRSAFNRLVAWEGKAKKYKLKAEKWKKKYHKIKTQCH